MSNKSETVYFLIPEALPFGWSFKMMAEYIVDRMPQFASVSGARKGAKLIDAIEKAEKDPAHVVAWPTDLWELVKAYLTGDGFQMPSNQVFRNGVPTDQVIGKRHYLPHIDAILEASDVVPTPKSVEKPVSENQPLPESAAEASTTAPEVQAPAA